MADIEIVTESKGANTEIINYQKQAIFNYQMKSGLELALWFGCHGYFG